MINGELSVFLLTCMSPNTNVTHGIKTRLVSFWSFGMYLSFESKNNSLRQSADSQSTKYSVSKHMVDPVCYNCSFLRSFQMGILYFQFKSGRITSCYIILTIWNTKVRRRTFLIFFSSKLFERKKLQKLSFQLRLN